MCVFAKKNHSNIIIIGSMIEHLIDAILLKVAMLHAKERKEPETDDRTQLRRA